MKLTAALICLATPMWAGGMAPPIEGYVPKPNAPIVRPQGDCSDVFYKDCKEAPAPKQPRPKPRPPQPEPKPPVKDGQPHDGDDDCACGGGSVREDVA